MQPNVDFSMIQAKRQAPRALPQAHYNIVVAGEFNAGKSSVINLLLRQQALPATVGFSEMPPTKIFPSDRAGYTVLTNANTPVSREEFLSGDVNGATIRSARVELDLPDFRGAAITEVSVGLDGRLDPEMDEVLHSADLLIWCTMAQRAWCLTEITVIESLPEHVMKGAILAVTRADYLRGEGQREMVQSRLEREAMQYFDQIVLLDASEKAVAQAAGERAWVESGGQALFDRVMARFRKSEKYGREAPVAQLQDLQSFRGKATKPLPAGGTIARSVDVFSLGADEPGQASIRAEEIALLWSSEVSLVADWVRDVPALEPAEFLDTVRDRLRGFAGAYLSPVLDFDEADLGGVAALRRLFEVRTSQFEGFARRHDAETAAVLAVDLICQIGEEIAQVPNG